MRLAARSVLVVALLSCAYDWTVPGGGATGTADGGGPTAAPATGATGAGGAGGEGAATSSAGGTADCAAPASCAECVACVAAERPGAPQCATYDQCMTLCQQKRTHAQCLGACAKAVPAGAAFRALLDARCTDICGATPPCP
jgi:hypothetical protein